MKHIPAQWNTCKLKDVALIGDGAHASIQRIDKGILYLTSKNFGADGLDLSKVDYISEDDYNKYFKKKSKALTKPKADDILLGIIGTLGAPYRVKEDDFFGLSSSVSIIRPDSEKLSSNYLYYWFKTPLFQNAINQIKSGVAQSFLSLAMIGSLPCIYPRSIGVQQKIAAILSAYDDLIENNLKRIKLLEEMAQITYEEWFVRLKFPGHETTSIDSETGLPEGWKMGKLFEKVELIKDSILPSNIDSKARYIGLEHMPRKSITLSEYGTAEDVGSLKIIVKEGDILFGKIRPYFHKAGIALTDCITSTDSIVLRPRKQLQGIILQTVFSDNFVSAAVQSSNGTKMPRANWGVLKNYPVIIPDKTVSIKFSAFSDSIISAISNLVNQNQLLKEARDILLPRLMTGMIDVEQLVLPEAFSNTPLSPEQEPQAV